MVGLIARVSVYESCTDFWEVALGGALGGFFVCCEEACCRLTRIVVLHAEHFIWTVPEMLQRYREHAGHLTAIRGSVELIGVL
jgi:hypothetical protein